MSLFYANPDDPLYLDVPSSRSSAGDDEPNRSFVRRPRVLVSRDYESCAIFEIYPQLLHAEPKLLPLRRDAYANHYALYRSIDPRARGFALVRVETTQQHQDNDAVLVYDCVRLLAVAATAAAAEQQYRGSLRVPDQQQEWRYSYDRNIAYSSLRPRDFADYELLSSGEWWYFDRGIVLNGTSVQDFVGRPHFAYLELHARGGSDGKAIELERNESRRFDPLAGAPAFSYTIGGGHSPRDSAAATASAVPQQQQRRSIASVVPSDYWFVERARELSAGSIEYFLPRRTRLDCGLFGPSLS